MMLEHDSYYKDQSAISFEERLKTNYDHPFAFDTDLLIEHLKDLTKYQSVEVPIYDYVAHTRSAEVYVQEPERSHHIRRNSDLEDERLRDLMDIKNVCRYR